MNAKEINKENVEDILNKIEKHLKEQLSKTNSNDEFAIICLSIIYKLFESIKPRFPDQKDHEKLLTCVLEIFFKIYDNNIKN